MPSTMALAQQAAAVACEIPSYHLADRIQSHAALIAIDSVTGSIQRVSANAGDVLGVAAETLLGLPANDWLTLGDGPTEDVPARACAVELRRPFARHVEAWTYRADGLVCVEIPVAGPAGMEAPPEIGPLDFIAMLAAITRAEGSVNDLARQVCASIHRITGFDRIYFCRFDESGHGRVPAEHLHAHYPSLLEHHFPRTDIPDRVRRLFLTQRFRLITDGGAEPVPVLVAPGHAPTLDMTLSSCRAVAESHLLYLRNLGAVASTSYAVVQAGRLAALFGGHHHAPRRLSFMQLMRCQQLVETFSSRAAELELRAQQGKVAARRVELLALTDAFAARHCELLDFVAADPGRIARLLDADGIVVAQGARVFSDLLASDDAQRILAWCRRNFAGDDQVSTAALSQAQPMLADLAAFATGVLAIRLGRDADADSTVLVWLRGEVLVQRKWSGDPDQALQRDESGRMNPRHSFLTYVQQLRGTAPPWEPHCAELAATMKSACNQILAGHYARRAQEEAERANRLMNEFVANVSHELRTPMHSIIGFSEAMIDRADAIGPDRRRQYLDIIRNSGHRLLELINDLLQLSKLESGLAPGAFEVEDIVACVNDAMTELRPLAGKKGVRLRGPDGVAFPAFAFDRRMIMRLLVNLLSNAVQYTPEGGRVSVMLESRSARRGGHPCCEIVVSDTGVGIPADELEQVFDKFVQSTKTKSGAGGTGLGLAICRRIVEEHGGEIWAESPPWGGARLVVQLPTSALARPGNEEPRRVAGERT